MLMAVGCNVCGCVQALREQDLIAIADAGDPIRYSPGELVALANPVAAATAFYLVTAGEVMLLPASLQIPPGTTQLDVSKVRLSRGAPVVYTSTITAMVVCWLIHGLRTTGLLQGLMLPLCTRLSSITRW
jgi:hypothetical protein